MYKNLQTKK